MHKIFLFCCVCMMATGCAKKEYTKPGSGHAEFSNDLLACQEVSKKLSGFENDSDVIRHCLEGKGWTYE